MGAVPVYHSFQINNTDNLTGVSRQLCVIGGSTTHPCFYRIYGYIAVANDSGTSATLSVGLASGGADFFNAVDLKASPTTNYSTAFFSATVDTTIYATTAYVGTAATVGTAYVVIEMLELSTTPYTNQGS